MQKPLFVYYVYYQDVQYPLAHAPIGWDKSEFSESIDERYYTLFRKFSSPLEFVFEGSDLLSKIFYTNGVDAMAKLQIMKLNKSTYQYKQIVLGDLDFSTFVQTKTGVTIGVMDSGIAANIKAYDEVVYAIPVEDNAVTVNIGGIGVNQFAEWIGVFSGYSERTRNTLCPNLISAGGTSEEEFITIYSDFGTSSGYLGDSFSPFLRVNRSFDSKITGSLKGLFEQNEFPDYLTEYITIEYFLNSNTGRLVKLSERVVRVNGPRSFDVDFDITINLIEDETWSFIAVSSSADSSGGVQVVLGVDSVNIKVEYRAYTEDYICKGLRAFDLYKALVQKMNPGIAVNAISDTFNSYPWRNLVIMSGDNIRGLAGATIQTSFKQYFEAMNAVAWCGIDVENETTLRLETRSRFYNRFVELADIGDVKSAKFEPSIKHHYSSIKVGYQDQEYNEVDGKDEFNTEESWSVTSTRIQTKKEIISPYRADPRGVDQLLIDFRAQKTTDTKSDKEVFMFKIRDTIEAGAYLLEGVEAFKSYTGVSALGNTYNIELSPRRCLIRHSSELAVPFALKKEGQIRFESSKKNAGLTTISFSDVKVKETDSINFIDMQDPLFLPVEVTVTSSMSDETYDKIVDNRLTHGYVSFNWDGKKYKGFLLESSFDIVRKSSKEIRLILTTDNILV